MNPLTMSKQFEHIEYSDKKRSGTTLFSIGDIYNSSESFQ